MTRINNDEMEESPYPLLNIVMRRHPARNNFAAILSTIRDLSLKVPEWLRDIFLGYGDPSVAHYTNMKGCVRSIDINDTFLDYEHLMNSLKDAGFNPVTLAEASNDTKKIKKRKKADSSVVTAHDSIVPPFVLTFPKLLFSGVADWSEEENRNGKRNLSQDYQVEDDKTVVVTNYTPLSCGPYKADAPKKNNVRFTGSQGKLAFVPPAHNVH